MVEENKIISIGIDPGSRNGAIAVIDSDLNILKLTKAPFKEEVVKSAKLKRKLNKDTNIYENSYKKRAWTSYEELKDILMPFKDNNIIYSLEKVFVMPNEANTQSFIFGNSFGIFQCLNLYIEPLAYYEPTPIEWKGYMGVTSDKYTSINLANKIFESSLRHNNIELKSKGKHSDLAEALLISFFGLSKYAKQVM